MEMESLLPDLHDVDYLITSFSFVNQRLSWSVHLIFHALYISHLLSMRKDYEESTALHIQQLVKRTFLTRQVPEHSQIFLFDTHQLGRWLADSHLLHYPGLENPKYGRMNNLQFKPRGERTFLSWI